jgi:zinc protease
MLDRKSPPPFVHSTSFDLLQPERIRLPNGIETFVVAGGSQDVFKIDLVIPAGRWYEHVRGASYFSANLLSKGTTTQNSFEIAQIFDRYGAHLEVQPGLDFVMISLYGLNRFLTPVLDLLLEMITQPSFPAKEIEQHKNIFLQTLKINEEKTSFLASKAFRKKLFGDAHPYGVELEENDINALQQEQIITHFNQYYQDVTLFVSGKIDNDFKKQIERQFSQLNVSRVREATRPAFAQEAFHDRITKEGSVQASIRMGKRSIMRTHPDYAEVIFVSHILGGYFGSRLMKNIREEKGLTYGIYASLHPLQRDGYVLIGADVNNENIDLTLNEIRKELKRLRTEKVSSEELDTAKNHFIGSLQSEITTPFAHADKIRTIFISNLQQDFYHQMILKINSMSAEQIISVSEKHLHEDSFSHVAAG